MVTIKVPTGEIFRAHAHLLAYHSDYFLAALNSSMLEATTLQFNFTEYADEESMEVFIFWIYEQSHIDWRYPPPVEFIERFGGPCGDRELDGKLAIKAYRMGDYLQAKRFKNEMIEVIYDYYDVEYVEENPLVSWSNVDLETLHPQGKAFHLLAAMMGNALYLMGYTEAKKLLDQLGLEARAAVVEFMAMQSLKLGCKPMPLFIADFLEPLGEDNE